MKEGGSMKEAQERKVWASDAFQQGHTLQLSRSLPL